ncbi:unnamed protein product [Meganyctiphanes norvegica]|uniref:Copper transport protein n=1 Tax=Meganyctiphanes norvegica TaxID=48144 RepID=A0AAV2RMI1_MEGNR
MMQMWFYFSSTYQDFLFKGVNVNTTWGMLSLCLGLMCLALLVEGLRVGRSQLFKLASQHRGCGKKEYKQRVQYHILQTILQLLQFVMSYILMLTVMTYNAYFMFAVIGGTGLGYFFFSILDFSSKTLGIVNPQPSGRGSNSTASEESGKRDFSEYTQLLPDTNPFESNYIPMVSSENQDMD